MHQFAGCLFCVSKFLLQLVWKISSALFISFMVCFISEWQIFNLWVFFAYIIFWCSKWSKINFLMFLLGCAFSRGICPVCIEFYSSLWGCIHVVFIAKNSTRVGKQKWATKMAVKSKKSELVIAQLLQSWIFAYYNETVCFSVICRSSLLKTFLMWLLIKQVFCYLVWHLQ